MPLTIPWSFHVERANNSFPTKALLITKAMLEYYFDISLPQRPNGTWKFILSPRNTSTPNAYAFTNGWLTYFSSNRNYNQDVKSVCAAARHELGHTPIAPGNVRSRHNSDPSSLMYYALNSNVMWTPNDWHYWFKSFPIKNNGCFNPTELARWFPAQDISMPDPQVTYLTCDHKPTVWQRFTGYVSQFTIPKSTHIDERQFQEEIRDILK